jgi:two-component system, LuxR family, response regulator FixJ
MICKGRASVQDRGVSMVHVIDDDGAVRESLEALLVVCGFEVMTYGSAEAYLATAPAADGCVLIDLHMPGMNGIDLLERLALLPSPPPVVVLTASREERSRERALELGARAYLTKPVGQEVLLEALAAPRP